jgi:peptide methionine sulfoxide reductase MsrA
VGYSQGTVKEPTYEQVCSGSTGHTEVVKVMYDEDAVTFEQVRGLTGV